MVCWVVVMNHVLDSWNVETSSCDIGDYQNGSAFSPTEIL